MRKSNSYDMSKWYWTRGALFQWKNFLKALRRRPPSRVYRGNKTFEVWKRHNTLFVKNISFAFPKSHNVEVFFQHLQEPLVFRQHILSKLLTYTVEATYIFNLLNHKFGYYIWKPVFADVVLTFHKEHFLSRRASP